MKKEIVGLVIGILIFLILLLIYSGESLLNLGKEASQAAKKISDTSTSVVENLVTRSDEEKIDIVEKIGTVTTGDKAGHGDVPIETIIIENVEVLD